MRSFVSIFYICLIAACTPQNAHDPDGWVATDYLQQPNTIAPEMAGQYNGKDVVVQGTVVTTFFAEKEAGSPTFFNLDKPFPNNDLTIVIFKDKLEEMHINRLDYEGKKVEVKGRISQYTDEVGKIRPSIEIKSSDQIKVL
jgi:uncharacterized membrane protein YcgQ (UPF0703/DUF1980 family)